MEERNDYSGEFIRHFRYEDFSKELLGNCCVNTAGCTS